MRRSIIMLLAYVSVGLAILSNLLYNVLMKLTPSGANPALALTVSYLIALGLSSTVLWVFFPLQTTLREAFQQLNWTSVSVGVVIVGIELGFLLAYRTGWKISLLQIIVSATVTLLLIPVGLMAFKEKVSWVNVVGVALCLAGLILVNLR
jgi:multidrug transporter EmrE-like cation transporter